MNKYILQQIVEKTPTEFWNDSCGIESLKRAVSWGATGATSNPVIVLGCIKAQPQRWVKEVAAIQKEQKAYSEIEIAWELIRRLATEAL